MRRWVEGVITVATLTAGCASPTGTGSETHFVCTSDESCIVTGHGNRCIDHACKNIPPTVDSGAGAPPSGDGSRPTVSGDVGAPVDQMDCAAASLPSCTQPGDPSCDWSAAL